jgi:hypothetical protein
MVLRYRPYFHVAFTDFPSVAEESGIEVRLAELITGGISKSSRNTPPDPSFVGKYDVLDCETYDVFESDHRKGRISRISAGSVSVSALITA